LCSTFCEQVRRRESETRFASLFRSRTGGLRADRRPEAPRELECGRRHREDTMDYPSINFAEKFRLLDRPWAPRVIAEMNDYQFKVVKLDGDFIWHRHDDTDETFVVLEGTLRIDFRDGAATVRAGEMFVVPKHVEHKPRADDEVKLLLIEPRGTSNTGEERGSRTVPNDVWI
jgi:mannose-6-phosphate isomerase-like protein (cupin superfamily)